MLDYVLLPVIILFLWYCLGRFIKPIGEFYATLFVGVGKVFLAVTNWLQAFSKSHESAYSKQPGLVVIVRLVAFVFALFAIVGEAYSSLVAIPALFGTELGTVKVPFVGLTAPAMAILFFSLSSLFGILWLEASAYTPAEVRLFEVPQDKVKGFRRFAFCSLVASLIATALFYVERKFYLLNPEGDITTFMQIMVFLFLGVLVPCAGAVAIWILAVGVQAIMNLVFSIVAFVASVVVVVLDFLGRHFSRGYMSVHDTTVIRRPGVYVDGEKDEVLPHPVEIGGALMRENVVGCFYGGSFGLQMLPIMERKMRTLRAESVIASGGVVNLYAQEEGAVSIGADVSPIVERAAILAAAANDEQAYTGLFDRLGEKVVDAHLPIKSIPSSLLFFLDRDVLTYTFDMLRTVKRQLPFHTIAVVTQLDETDRRSETVRKGLQGLVELYEQGIIATTFVFSSRSRFAVTVKRNGGDVKQMEFVGQTLTSLLLARKHSMLNRSCVEVLRALGRLSPFIGFAFATDRVSPMKLRGLRALLQLLAGKKTTVGDQDNIREQAEHITRQVLTDPECRAINEAIQSDMPAILVYNIPLALSDRRFSYVQRGLTNFLGRFFPLTGGLTVRGNGIPVHIATEPLDPFYVQANCLYPLQPAFFDTALPELSRLQEQVALPLPKEQDVSGQEVAASAEAATQDGAEKRDGRPKKSASV